MKNLFKKISQIFVNSGLIILLALLGAVGGQGPKELRRYILPAVVTIYAYFMLQNWWVLTIYSLSGVLSIGYGRYDPNDNKSSFLGKVAYKLFPQSQVLQDIMIRGIVGILICITMLSVPILTWNWVSYLLGSVGIILIWALVSWRGFGEMPIKLFGKEYQLLKVDLTVYAVTVCGIILIINGWLG